jgi:hypothetical protein
MKADPLLPLLVERTGEDSPLIAAYLETCRETGGEALVDLLATVDESHYSLRDWADALAAFDRWLAARNERRRPFREMVGYLHCCTLPDRPGVALAKLDIIVNEALTEYGFSFTSDSHP